jgi:DHA1 family bicyclomycin/chloramphenicol resistance-like MFS transporter
MKGFIILMASFMASVAISIDAMLPALKSIGESLNVADINHTQYIIVSIFAGMAAGQLVCGPLSDALGRKKILYAGLALYALGSLVCLFSQSLTVMLAGRLLQGLGVSGPYVSAIAIIRDKCSGSEMARVMSLVMMIFIIVPSLAPALGQAILLFLTWRYIFALLFLVAVALAARVYFGLEETLPPEKRLPFDAAHIKAGFREVFSSRVTACHTVCMGLIFGGFTGYLNSTRQIFQDLFQTGKLFSLYFGGLALIFGVSSLLNAQIVRKVGMRHLCRYAVTAVIASSAVFLVYCSTSGAQLWPFLIYASVLYFAMGLMFGNLNAIAMEPMGHIAGIASAVIGSTSSIISLCLGALIGQLFNGTLVPVTTGFLVLGIGCFLVLRMADAGQDVIVAEGQ